MTLAAVLLLVATMTVPEAATGLPGNRLLLDSTDVVTWETRAVCPYSCRRCGSASDGTYFYVLGGWDGVNTRAYNYRYDPGANSWTQRQNMPTAVSNAGVCYSPRYNAIFVFGGLVQSGDSVTLVQRYDVAANSWTSNSTLPYQDYGIAAVALGDYVYVLFGSGHPGRFWRYYPPAGTWVELAQCTGASSHAALCVLAGQVYASGGWTQNSMFKRYNPGNNMWQNLTPLPQARHGHGMDTVGTRIYLYGGGQTWGATQNCYSYDPADSTWSSEGNMLQPHVGGAFAAVVTGGITRLHAACGYYATDRHERGSPASPDVGVVAIVAPAGTIDTLQPVAPACSVANFGPAPVSFRVRCRIGAFYNDTTQASNLAPGERARVTFSSRADWPRGLHAVTCSTELAGDANPANDGMTDSVRVNVRDVGTRVLLAPSGSVDSGVTVVPACSLFNCGTTTETYRVRLRIGTVHTDTVTVSSHAPDSTCFANFAPWVSGPRGTFAVSCSTELATDANPTNDRETTTVDVRVIDIAVDDVLRPLAWERPGVVPVTIRISNRGTTEASGARVIAVIRDSSNNEVYRDSAPVQDLLPGARTEVSLSSWPALVGTYRLHVRTILTGDMNPGNDSMTVAVTVTAAGAKPWTECSSMPGLPSSKQTKDGAWLAAVASGEWLYAAKGNKTGDFYRYDPVADSWAQLASIPLGREGRPPSKGAAGCVRGSGLVYATKGNNTCGFYCYDVQADSWHQLADVPLGTTNRKVKGGTDLVYVPSGTDREARRRGDEESRNQGVKESRTDSGLDPLNPRPLVPSFGYVYLLKGQGNEFWCYQPAVDSWRPLSPAPAAKWDKGSWLAYDDAGTVYAHQAKYHGFYAYDLATGSWSPALAAMPMVGRSGRVKKSKDGGCGSWLAGIIFALKGGNTQEFWCYRPEGDSWTELDTMPAVGRSGQRRKVKAGADIAATSGALFALKGNKTLELWQYIPGGGLRLTANDLRPTGVMAQRQDLRYPFMLYANTPNPFRAATSLRYSLPREGLVSLRVYDVSGRNVRTLASNWQRPGLYSVTWDGRDAHGRFVANGIYFCKLRASGEQMTRKLVLQR
jgi:N-acetylneuraminic acid mutarotase